MGCAYTWYRPKERRTEFYKYFAKKTLAGTRRISELHVKMDLRKTGY
jgi:hypothetical protein